MLTLTSSPIVAVPIVAAAIASVVNPGRSSPSCSPALLNHVVAPLASKIIVHKKPGAIWRLFTNQAVIAMREKKVARLHARESSERQRGGHHEVQYQHRLIRWARFAKLFWEKIFFRTGPYLSPPKSLCHLHCMAYYILPRISCLLKYRMC